MTLLPGANVGSAASLASTASADEANCVPIDDNSEHFSILQSTRLNFVPPKPKILQGACQTRLAGPGWPGPAPAEQLAANADGHWRTAGQDNIRHMYLYRTSAREPLACSARRGRNGPARLGGAVGAREQLLHAQACALSSIASKHVAGSVDVAPMNAKDKSFFTAAAAAGEADRVAAAFPHLRGARARLANACSTSAHLLAAARAPGSSVEPWTSQQGCFWRVVAGGSATPAATRSPLSPTLTPSCGQASRRCGW